MIKVLIAEDEILARVGIRQIIDWNAMGLTLLDDAKDGQEALQMIDLQHPDIILLDLNLPKIHGLEILKYITQKKLTCKVIVITCNEEFQTIKTAASLGAFEYLRKFDLSSDEILRVIRKCMYALNNPSNLQNAPLLPFWSELNYNDLLNAQENRIFSFCSQYKTIVCILPQIGGKQNIHRVETISRNFFENRRVSCQNIIKGNHCSYFMLTECQPDSFYESWKQLLDCAFSLPVYIGISGGSITTVSQIHEHVILSEQILTSCYYGHTMHIQKFNNRFSYNQNTQCINQLFSLLRKNIYAFQEEKIQETFQELFNCILKNPYFPVSILRRYFMDILGIYSGVARSLGCVIEDIRVNGENTHYQTILMMSNMHLIQQWFSDFHKAFMQRFWVEYKCSQSDIIQKAVAYVRNNLHSPVQLHSAAKEIGISETHLSTVFKKEMKINFISFVNMEKVNAAKPLLKAGMKVTEVSDLLGYEDSSYFSKVFKRYAGVSPADFR